MNSVSAFEYMFAQLTPLNSVLCLLAGILTGIFYFLSLWWTIKRISVVEKRGLFLFLSALIRLTAFFGVLILVADRNVLKMLIFFIGFMAARIVTIRYKKKQLLAEVKEQKNA